MLPRISLILIIPAIIYAEIKVKAVIKSQWGEHRIEVFGEASDIINQEEANLFEFTEEKLKDAIEKISGKRPDNIYLSDPTPIGTVYEVFKIKPVMKTVTPIAIHFEEVNNPGAPIRRLFSEDINRLLDNNTELNLKFSQSTAGHLSTNWQGTNLSVNSDIEYDIQIFMVGDQKRYVFNTNIGINDHKIEAHYFNLYCNVSIPVIVEENQCRFPYISSTKGNATIKVDYQATLTSGIIAAYYKDIIDQNKFLFYPVQSIMRATGWYNYVYFSEVITFEYSLDRKVYVRYQDTGELLYSIPENCDENPDMITCDNSK